jgi:hypothetical protein
MSHTLTYLIGASLTLADLEGEVHPTLHKLRAAEPVSWLPVLSAWLRPELSRNSASSCQFTNQAGSNPLSWALETSKAVTWAPWSSSHWVKKPGPQPASKTAAPLTSARRLMGKLFTPLTAGIKNDIMAFAPLNRFS